MAESTGISWADATFNPWVGCTKVSTGCKFCYAQTLVEGRMGRGGTWGPQGVREVTAPGTWQKPRKWARMEREGLLPNGAENKDGHRPRIFCASLADVFEDRPEVLEARFRLFELIDETPELDWLVLTKRPDFAHEWLQDWYAEHGIRTGRFVAEWATRDGLDWGCPPNLWMGVSIENLDATWRADILREIPAVVRFISAEPLVGSLYEDRVTSSDTGHGPSSVDAPEGGSDTRGRTPLDLSGIDWVIAGGESGGQLARPMHPTWVREIRDDCAARDIAFHGKQWGAWTPDTNGTDRNGFWVSPDGRKRSAFAADATGDLPDGSVRMRYAGASPTSGGKILDGVDHCAFPREKIAA